MSNIGWCAQDAWGAIQETTRLRGPERRTTFYKGSFVVGVCKPSCRVLANPKRLWKICRRLRKQKILYYYNNGTPRVTTDLPAAANKRDIQKIIHIHNIIGWFRKADRSCITIKYALLSGKRLNRSENDFLFVAIHERYLQYIC